MSILPASRRYLDRYAEPLSKLGTDAVSGHYDHVVVIPVYQESATTLDAIMQHQQPDWGEVLVVMVFNSPSGEGATAELMHELIERSRRSVTAVSGAWLLHNSDHLHSLLVDCCTPGREIPGVGAARKLGADIALTLIADHQIADPFIYNTDADVILPSNYFSDWQHHARNPDIAVRIYPFVHEPEPGWEIATYLYEIAMHYYVLGLRSANSPYSYHTIGSTLSISAEAYAKVRGFPKKDAAEDFYLLNKLQKVGKILRPSDWLAEASAVIHISGRPSDRVPFGTGPALIRARQLSHPTQDYQFYHPDIFQELKQIQMMINQFSNQSEQFSIATQSWIDSSGFAKAWHNAEQQSQQIQVRKKALTDWFDGFRTLKLAHHLRDESFSSQPLQTILTAAFLPEDIRSMSVNEASTEKQKIRLVRDRMATAAFGFDTDKTAAGTMGSDSPPHQEKTDD